MNKIKRYITFRIYGQYSKPEVFNEHDTIDEAEKYLEQFIYDTKDIPSSARYYIQECFEYEVV
jgi:hypothetical protein